ncbi:phosphatase PAP2 family protein [Herpetosiphon geysericola]|uniref:phosphatase PAP2 family protein n=1 Tax=Herpetosiphon geysericola TaxID=70996 RepID=UPI0006C90668|nr:phosphatase PAP2 family protein [Herpetosiphon geysericola]
MQQSPTNDTWQADVSETAIGGLRAILISTAATACLIAIFWWLSGFINSDINQFDLNGLAGGFWLRSHAPYLTPIFYLATWIGTLYGLSFQTLLVGYWLCRRKPTAWRSRLSLIVLALLGAAIWMTVLKQGFERPRPSIFEPAYQISTYSFPSGHAMAAAAWYGSLAIVLSYGQRPQRRWGLISGLAVMAVLIGISRVVFAVHYPTDISAGWIGGIAWLACLRTFWHGISWQRQRRRAN